MGTRSTVKIIDTETKLPLVSIYQQYDGYPTGVGKELFSLLKKAELVNGYHGNDKIPFQFNGMGCLAAWLVKKLKRGIGNTYITNADDKQEYNYEIYEDINGVLKIRCFLEDGTCLFDLCTYSKVTKILKQLMRGE